MVYSGLTYSLSKLPPSIHRHGTAEVNPYLGQQSHSPCLTELAFMDINSTNSFDLYVSNKSELGDICSRQSMSQSAALAGSVGLYRKQYSAICINLWQLLYITIYKTLNILDFLNVIINIMHHEFWLGNSVYI